MKLIVGLGNPGIRYQNTRHNIGKLLIEYAALKLSQKWAKQKTLFASIAALSWEGQSLILAYPEIFMNVSGESVKRLCHRFDVNVAKDLLIVVDDVALPFGRFRLRARGSHGGHNGLKSIERLLGTSCYARLRFGVGSPEPKDVFPLEDYVLGSWNFNEKQEMPFVLDRGLEAIRLWTGQGVEAAMNVINPSKKKG